MSQLIAGLYEIEEQIGAGGGGVVYLGRHTRLDKTVVLKADKRRLSTNTEVLRREVDMLKNLSHTYIPQVYDFVQEDGMVYTVMDFIEGESLDKMLGRKQIPSQPQVIEWACQLLEALCYLHGQPPHGILHADIKPANIMLRPNGKICLIDYNIALALGEDGAVKVGFSRGYASPEHYGADYISANRPAAVGLFTDSRTGAWQKSEKDDRTEVDDRTEADEEATVAGSSGSANNSGTANSTGSKKGGILLDVRSDIYSLGATLYHLLSGRKPASDAREVEPLDADVCSPAVSVILQKAMAPMPEDRFQTAAEMLTAIHELHTRDVRVLRHKRRMAVSAVALTALFLAGGCSTFVGLKQMEQRQEAMALAEYSANALAQGDVSTAVSLALQAIPDGNSILDAPVTPQARKALTDALGVYDLSDGFKVLDTTELPGAPFTVAVSPQGTRFAVVYAYEVAVYELETNAAPIILPVQTSALSDVVFLDENRVIYAGEQGVTAYDLEEGKVLWNGEEATCLSLSADGSRVAAVNRDEHFARVYETADGTVAAECSFGDRNLPVAANDIFADAQNYILSLNHDGSLLAVSFDNGGLTIFDIAYPDDSMILYEESDYVRFEGGFYGDYFAFAADKSAESSFGLVDTVKAEYVGGFTSQNNFLVHVGSNGIFLANGNLLVAFEPETLKQTELAYTGNVNIRGFCVGEEYVLVTMEDDSFAFYDRGAHMASAGSFGESCDFAMLAGKYAILGNRDKPLLRLLKLENHEEAQLLAYDARYAHDEARVSQDGQTVMLFDYERFRIYDREGKSVAEMELPDAAHIYDQQFQKTENGSWLEVIWYDGTVRHYSAADGSLLSETVGAVPDKSLTEEFITDRYRIVSSLHEAPMVYDLRSGREVAVLEKDDYLTYVTQVGDYLLTEYIDTEGLRYGLLLDQEFQTLAYLPNLCDVTGDELVFDYESGNLRHCRLYSLQELIALGETYMSHAQKREQGQSLDGDREKRKGGKRK